VPFHHGVRPVSEAGSLYRDYLDLVSDARDASAKAGLAQMSHNFVMTSEWMLVAPRSAESWRSVSVNSTGMVGMILVKQEEDMELVQSEGILNVLRRLGVPKL